MNGRTALRVALRLLALSAILVLPAATSGAALRAVPADAKSKLTRADISVLAFRPILTDADVAAFLRRYHLVPRAAYMRLNGGESGIRTPHFSRSANLYCLSFRTYAYF